jgi:hypothetical protein
MGRFQFQRTAWRLEIHRKYVLRPGNVEMARLPGTHWEATGDQQSIGAWPSEERGTGCQRETLDLVDQPTIGKQRSQPREPWLSHFLQRAARAIGAGRHPALESGFFPGGAVHGLSEARRGQAKPQQGHKEYSYYLPLPGRDTAPRGCRPGLRRS